MRGTPVLVGDRDSVIPFALGRAVRAHHGKRFVTIAGTDHNDAPTNPRWHGRRRSIRRRRFVAHPSPNDLTRFELRPTRCS
jgi:hypothetical protein